MGRFDKLLDLDHPAQVLVKPMSMGDRAKIFLPFSALTSLEEALRQAEREREDIFTDKNWEE